MQPNPNTTQEKWVSKKLWTEIRQLLEQEPYLIQFDVETTGLSAAKERIIEIGAIRYKVKKFKLVEDKVLHHYINPGRVLKNEIIIATGITNEFLADKPTEEQVFPEIAEFFSDTAVAGYNVPFDLRFTNELYARNGSVYQNKGVIDVIRMARERIPKENIDDYKLESVGRYYDIQFRAHSALEDARATAALCQIFISEYLKLEAAAAPEKTGTARPVIERIGYWPGYRGFARIYVETSAGSLYYDLRGHRWGSKDANIVEIDMEWLEAYCWKLTGCKDETEFCRYKETWNAA